MFRLIFLIILMACSRGPEEYREEAQGIMRAMVLEFKKIHGREELMEKEGKVQLLFDKLVLILAETESYLSKHPEFEALEFKWKDQDLSDELKGEINRLYRLEGCKEIIEECQKKALQKAPALLNKLT